MFFIQSNVPSTGVGLIICSLYRMFLSYMKYLAVCCVSFSHGIFYMRIGIYGPLISAHVNIKKGPLKLWKIHLMSSLSCSGSHLKWFLCICKCYKCVKVYICVKIKLLISIADKYTGVRVWERVNGVWKEDMNVWINRPLLLHCM